MSDKKQENRIQELMNEADRIAAAATAEEKRILEVVEEKIKA